MSAPLAAGYDRLLVDLDGTAYAGAVAIPGAAAALDGLPVTYVTNNASRGPGDVAQHLRDLGFAAPDDTVVTSAQAGAGLLASLVPASFDTPRPSVVRGLAPWWPWWLWRERQSSTRKTPKIAAWKT